MTNFRNRLSFGFNLFIILNIVVIYNSGSIRFVWLPFLGGCVTHTGNLFTVSNGNKSVSIDMSLSNRTATVTKTGKSPYVISF